ncbi:hypothetical protein MASB_10370 [Mycobacteroides abscessus subsp. bolletii BD]|nr:hypothetical protein MASB_10370 [Mycobacteroides abscessus subsp. bolletii BD]
MHVVVAVCEAAAQCFNGFDRAPYSERDFFGCQVFFGGQSNLSVCPSLSVGSWTNIGSAYPRSVCVVHGSVNKAPPFLFGPGEHPHPRRLDAPAHDAPTAALASRYSMFHCLYPLSVSSAI